MRFCDSCRVGFLPYGDEDLCQGCCGCIPERTIHLDHDHDLMLFRGWLCSNCNTGIGMFGDGRPGTIERLEAAIKTF